MFAIFKRELRSYFTSLVGYVVIGVMLAFIGLYYSANCLVYGTSDFSTVLYSTTLVMLFLLPALTMRSFADERRNKTDQLLLTSPVGIPSIVMGKYFAQLAVFAVPMAAAAIMPLVLTGLWHHLPYQRLRHLAGVLFDGRCLHCPSAPLSPP